MIESTEFLEAIDRNPQSVYIMYERTEFLLPWHEHHKGQLIYIQGGVAYIHLVDKTLVIPSRHYVWIPKGLRHYVEMHRSVSIISLYFSFEDDDGHPFFKKGGIYPINSLLMQMLDYCTRWEGDVFPHDKAYSFVLAIKNLLPDISIKALPISLPTTDHARMKPVINYINQHLYENLTMAELCARTGFSERSLARLFQDTLNTSFHRYFKLLRMVRAIELILENDKSLSEIAYMLGYNNISAFSNIFAQLTGMRPSDFLKQLHL